MRRREHEPTARVVQRALDSLRIVLVAALVGLLYWQPGQPAVDLDPTVRLAIGLVAGLYGLAIIAAWLMWSSRRWRRRSFGPATLLAGDYLVAVGLLVAGDPSTEVLTWVPFIFPIVSAAATFGLVAAVGAWMAISAVYLPIRVSVVSSDASREALEVGARVVGGLAIFGGIAALSILYFQRRLAAAQSKMGQAERFAGKLGDVALASRHLRGERTPGEVLRGAVHNTTRLGFADADVCERRESRPWSVTYTSRRGERPPADAELLSNAAVHSRGTVTRTIESHEENAQGLHIAARRAVMATPIATEPGHWLVLRAWVHENDAMPGHRDRQAFELLAAIVGDAWRNTQQIRNLESRSKALAQRANHDALTGVANRGWMLRHLGDRLRPEYGRSQPTALLYVDLEGIKEANETFGHEIGDQALVEVARRIRSVVPEEHAVGRLGGDEFLAVVDLATGDDPLRLGEAICSTLGEEMVFDDMKIIVGASVGIALAEPDADPEELIKRADAAVYVSRQAGGATKLRRSRGDGAIQSDWGGDLLEALETEASSLPSWAQDLVDAAEAAAQLAEALPDDWEVERAEPRPEPAESADDDRKGNIRENNTISEEIMYTTAIELLTVDDIDNDWFGEDGEEAVATEAGAIGSSDEDPGGTSPDEMARQDEAAEPEDGSGPRLELVPEVNDPPETIFDHDAELDRPPLELVTGQGDGVEVALADDAVGEDTGEVMADEVDDGRAVETDAVEADEVDDDEVDDDTGEVMADEADDDDAVEADEVDDDTGEVMADDDDDGSAVEADDDDDGSAVEADEADDGSAGAADEADHDDAVEADEVDDDTGEVMADEADHDDAVEAVAADDTGEVMADDAVAADDSGEAEAVADDEAVDDDAVAADDSSEAEVVADDEAVDDDAVAADDSGEAEAVAADGEPDGAAQRLADALPGWDDDALDEFYLDTDPAT